MTSTPSFNSDIFLAKLDKTALGTVERQIIEAASHSLDLKIAKRRDSVIQLKNETLLKTLSCHFKDLVEGTQGLFVPELSYKKEHLY